MIILHENMPLEAEKAAESLKEAYGAESRIVEADLSSCFPPLPEFEGFYGDFNSKEYNKLLDEYAQNNEQLLLLTDRDMYFRNRSKDDDWIFGFSTNRISAVSSARMKRHDSQPGKSLEIPESLYLKRIGVLSVHEIGHNLVDSPLMHQAVYVNAITGIRLPLGPHCIDNTCAMYEIIDIKTPSPERAYMLVGNEKRYDAGLDDLIGRMNPNWLCDSCRSYVEKGSS